MRIFKSKWFQRFSRREGIEDRALRPAVERAAEGGIDANLGGGVIRQEIAWAGEGRSAGCGAIILFQRAERAVLVFGFAKDDRAGIKAAELEQFRQAARHVLELSNRQLSDLVTAGDFRELDDRELED